MEKSEKLTEEITLDEKRTRCFNKIEEFKEKIPQIEGETGHITVATILRLDPLQIIMGGIDFGREEKDGE